MKHRFTRLVAASWLAVVHLAGNAQNPALPAPQDAAQPAPAASPAQDPAPCCQQLGTFARVPLPLEKTELKLDEKSPAHNFGQGTQAFLLLELPAYTKTYSVSITSLPSSPTPFNRTELSHVALRIQTLDADFAPLRAYPHTGMKKRGYGYEKTVFINPSNQNERYLLIYGALNVEPEKVTVSRTDVVFVGTGYYIGGTDQALTLKATSSGALQIEAKGLLPEKP